MDNSLTFLYIVFFISIVLHIAGAIITAAFVIPLQLKEVGVKNGLAILRKQLLIKGVLSLVVAVVSILALTLRYIVPDMEILRYLITSMILFHSVGLLGKAWIDYKIYHQMYTPEIKSFHEKVAKMEAKEEKQKAS